MSKQITREELAEIFTKLLVTDEIDNAGLFAEFMTDAATLITRYCGGEVRELADNMTDEWLVGVYATPDCNSIWAPYDLEGEFDIQQGANDYRNPTGTS